MSEHTLYFSGTLFDGRSSARQQVDFDLTPSGIILKFSDGRKQTWDFSTIRWNPASDQKKPPFHIDHPADEERVETLIVDHPAFLKSLRRMAPEALDSDWDRRPWMRWGAIAAGILAVPFFIYVVWYLAIPSLADRVAMQVPVEWEVKLGETVLNGVLADSVKEPDPQKKEVIDRIVDRLLTADPDQPYEIKVYIFPKEIVNALALPGGHIILFQGLLDKTETPEELAGVLAHEIQHVTLRHSTRAIIRALASSVLITLMVGDSNGVMQGVIDVAGELNGLRLSRRMENEADEKGMEMVQAAEIDPLQMISMYEKLMEEEKKVMSQIKEAVGPEKDSWFDYFSTHPAGEDRIQNLKQRIGNRSDHFPILPGADWKALMHSEKE
jgi:predicted Zn-dependent protease